MQEKLNRSLMVCQDKYETAKQQNKPGELNDLESRVDQSTQDSIKMLPHLRERLKVETKNDNGEGYLNSVLQFLFRSQDQSLVSYYPNCGQRLMFCNTQEF